MTKAGAWGIEVEGLERALRAVEPGVVLVEPRVLRRVIKHDCKMTTPGLQVPHRKTYVLDAAAAAEIVERDELGQDARAELAGDLILLGRPAPEDLAGRPAGDVLLKYWRLLFHARVDLALDRRSRDGALGPAEVTRRVHELGQTEFDEIRSVLRYEDYLLPPRDRRMVYREFAAVYLELRHFAPSLLPLYFPSLAEHGAVVAAILARDVDAGRIFAETRPAGAAEPEAAAEPAAQRHEAIEAAVAEDPEAIAEVASERQHRALLRRAERSHRRGNVVRAAIFRAGPPGRGAGRTSQRSRRRPRDRRAAPAGASWPGWPSGSATPWAWTRPRPPSGAAPCPRCWSRRPAGAGRPRPGCCSISRRSASTTSATSTPSTWSNGP